MRKKKILFIIILALAVIAAVLINVDKPITSDRISLMDITDEELESVIFHAPDGAWTIENTNGSWKVVGSEKTSDTALTEVVETLKHYDGKELMKNPENKNEFGFTENSYKIEYVKTNGETVKYTLGNMTPAETEYYLMDEAGTVYSVYSIVGGTIKTPKYQVLDSFVYGIDYADIASVEVDGYPPITLTKYENYWLFESEGYTEEVVTEKIRQTVTRHLGGMYAKAVIDEVTPEKEAECGFSASDTVETVTVTDKNGAQDKLYVGKETDEGVYVKVEGKTEIFLVIADYFKFIKSFREVVL